jgi:cytochrome c5
MSQEQDRIFFRNYLIVLGLLALMIVIFLLAARAIGAQRGGLDAQRTAQVSEATKPVGQVRMAGDEEPAMAAAPVAQPEAPAVADASADDAGKRVYSGLCFSCHGTGLPGIPQLGDHAAWEARLADVGIDMMYEHAINGFTGASGIMMPPKGGNPALSDDEVKAAVDYMVAADK